MRLTWFRKNAIVLILAVLVGGLSIAPSVLAIFAIGRDYQGIPFYFIDDEDIYTARMHEVIDGHWLIGSPFFHEYKKLIPTMPPVGEYVYALPSLVTRIPLVYIVLATKFLFPALLFLIVFFLFKELCGEEDGREKPSARLAGIAAGLAVTLAYDAAGIMSLVRHDAGIHLSIWTRTVNPILGALAVFSFLIFFWRAVRGGRKKDIFAAGLILALSFAYFFSWGMALSVAFVYSAVLLAMRRWNQLKRAVWVGAVGLLWSIPSLALVIYSLSQGGSGSAAKNGMSFTHIPLLNKTLLAAIAVFAGLSVYGYFSGKRKIFREDWWIFSAAMLLGALWTFSQQIVTGRTIWPYHFVQYSKPLATLVLLLAGFKLIYPKFPKLFNGLMACVCLFSLANGAVMAASYRYKVEDFRKEQGYAPLYAWLDKNAAKDCVVLVKEKGEFLARQIPAFTHCDVYISSWTFSGVPPERVLHNFFVYLKMNGVTADGAKDYLTQNQDEVRGYFYENWDQMFAKSMDSWLQSKIDSLAPAYAEFLKKDFSAELKKYRLDYLVSAERLKDEDAKVYGLSDKPEQVGNEFIYQPAK